MSYKGKCHGFVHYMWRNSTRYGLIPLNPGGLLYNGGKRYVNCTPLIYELWAPSRARCQIRECYFRVRNFYVHFVRQSSDDWSQNRCAIIVILNQQRQLNQWMGENIKIYTFHKSNKNMTTLQVYSTVLHLGMSMICVEAMMNYVCQSHPVLGNNIYQHQNGTSLSVESWVSLIGV